MRTIGFLPDQECRKTWHTKSTEMFHLQYVDHVEEILWRKVLGRMHCMLMDLLHGFEVLSTTEETLFNSQI